jgi:hypothetical protein
VWVPRTVTPVLFLLLLCFNLFPDSSFGASDAEHRCVDDGDRSPDCLLSIFDQPGDSLSTFGVAIQLATSNRTTPGV